MEAQLPDAIGIIIVENLSHQGKESCLRRHHHIAPAVKNALFTAQLAGIQPSFFPFPAVRLGKSSCGSFFPPVIPFPASIPESRRCRCRMRKLPLISQQTLIGPLVLGKRRQISALRRQMLLQHILQGIAVEKHLISRRGHYHHVHIGINEHILPQHAVEGELARSFTGPDLIAIARKAGIFRRHDLCIHRLSYPVFRNHLLPFPFSAVQIELAELRHILHTEKESPAALVFSFGTGLPEDPRDAQRRKKSRL